MHNITTQRLQSQYEAIAAQRGGEREGVEMFREWLVHVRDCQNRCWGRSKWDMVTRFFMVRGAAGPRLSLISALFTVFLCPFPGPFHCLSLPFSLSDQ